MVHPSCTCIFQLSPASPGNLLGLSETLPLLSLQVILLPGANSCDPHVDQAGLSATYLLYTCACELPLPHDSHDVV